MQQHQLIVKREEQTTPEDWKKYPKSKIQKYPNSIPIPQQPHFATQTKTHPNQTPLSAASKLHYTWHLFLLLLLLFLMTQIFMNLQLEAQRISVKPFHQDTPSVATGKHLKFVNIRQKKITECNNNSCTSKNVYTNTNPSSPSYSRCNEGCWEAFLLVCSVNVTS